MSLHPKTEAAFDEIDAAFFTGDPTETREIFARLKYFVGRWQRRLEEESTATQDVKCEHELEMTFLNILTNHSCPFCDVKAGEFCVTLVGTKRQPMTHFVHNVRARP